MLEWAGTGRHSKSGTSFKFKGIKSLPKNSKFIIPI